MPANRSADDVVLALCGGTAVNGATPAENRYHRVLSMVPHDTLTDEVHALPVEFNQASFGLVLGTFGAMVDGGSLDAWRAFACP